MNTVKINAKETKIVAHRGLSGIERENTCPAFVAAGNRNYYGIETDIHVTKDGKFVVIHDETTKRVSLEKYDINVEENDYDALKDIVLPDKDGSFSRGDIRIPLLCEYVNICKKYGKVCVLEIKNRFSYDDLVKTVKEIEELEYLDNIVFISFCWENCVDLRAILPDAKIQWLTSEEITDEKIEQLVEHKLELDIYHIRLTKEMVEKLHSKGISVNCWTCDDKARADELIEMGVDFITTNILENE